MKAFLQSIVFLLVFNSVFMVAQDRSFVATYKIKYTPINFDSTLTSNDTLKPNKVALEIYNEIKKGEEELNKIQFKLEYQKGESFFYEVPKLDLDKEKVRLLYLVLNLKDEKYFTNKEELIIQRNSFGEDFLVKMPFVNWDITNEKRKIGNYVCYKATTIKNVENSKGVHKVKIEAWFAPEIPFNFGPKNYSGLPGLIIELKEGVNLTYQLITINEKKYKKIIVPTKGKKITQKEFTALSKEMYENRGN